MANNYYDATGTLTLKKVTPVIKALFGNLELDPDYPGKVAESAEVLKVYIANISESTSAGWDVDALVDLCELIGLSPQTDGRDDSEILESVLSLLGSHFLGEVSEEDPWSLLVKSVLADYANETDADLQLLFALAKFLDDGHGLQSLLMEGCWHSSKPRLGEFGGHFVFVGKNFSQAQDTSSGSTAAAALEEALAKPAGAQEAAAELALEHVKELLEGITDEAQRTEVRKLLTMALSIL